MKILVIVRMAPDVVEELEVAADGRSLDKEFLRMIPSESDDHALEEALLLKEQYGGEVTVISPAAPELDDVLYTALAKGADHAIRVEGIEEGLGTRRVAEVLAQALSSDPRLLPADLVLTGVQSIDDLDGLAAPLVAHHLGLPHVAIVTHVTLDPGARRATVVKEFAGGVRGEFEAGLPVVLGIQAAEKPPRYVPVAKVRAARTSRKIETIQAPEIAGGPELIEVLEMKKPEAAGRVEMLGGAPEEAAEALANVFARRGLL
jgi:electron transfer flavoprotein beta subunit